jgi:hypothetical protein
MPAMKFAPFFRHFLRLRSLADFNKEGTETRSGDGVPRKADHFGVIMESSIQKSCWNITFRALIGFASVLAIVYLFGRV